jgi:hypothetical protein
VKGSPAVYNENDLIQLQAQTLFVQSQHGRLVQVNEAEPEEPAPRFYLSVGRASYRWWVRHDVPTELINELDRVLKQLALPAELHDLAPHMQPCINLLEQQASIAHIFSGPAYYLPPGDFTSQAIRITAANASLLETHFPYTRQHLSERDPVSVIVMEGRAVAACYAARQITQAAEAGVDTLESYRGRGYAVETAKGWAGAVYAAGKIPFYSTSWDNQASQAVARKLNAVHYAVTYSIT